MNCEHCREHVQVCHCPDGLDPVTCWLCKQAYVDDVPTKTAWGEVYKCTNKDCVGVVKELK
jgi:hypothetical protein